jgi:hypothetical protein
LEFYECAYRIAWLGVRDDFRNSLIDVCDWRWQLPLHERNRCSRTASVGINSPENTGVRISRTKSFRMLCWFAGAWLSGSFGSYWLHRLRPKGGFPEHAPSRHSCLLRMMSLKKRELDVAPCRGTSLDSQIFRSGGRGRRSGALISADIPAASARPGDAVDGVSIDTVQRSACINRR